MKVTVRFKTPDAVHYACKDVAEDSAEAEALEEEVVDILGSGEYVTLIVDTETREVTIKKGK